jgi:hypothetical protein
VLNDPNYVTGAGADTRVRLGAFLELITLIAGIGTAVTLFSILKRQNEGFALGYVATRVLESTIMVVGIIGVLSVVTLRQDFAGGGGDPGALKMAGQTLVTFHEWTRILGPQFCAGFGNGILLGYLMFRSGLVPRPMATWGLFVGGPVALLAGILLLFGAGDPPSGLLVLLTIPEIVWEGFIAIYCTWKGFRPSRILADL